jgi:hypothetical protein
VIEKGIQRSRWSDRADGIRIVRLNEDGTLMQYPQSDFNDRNGLTGKFREHVLAARLILDLAEVERREEEARKLEEERERRIAVTEQAKAEIEDKIGDFFKISAVDIHVRITWDSNLGEPVPQNVRMDDVFAFMDAMDQISSNGKKDDE